MSRIAALVVAFAAVLPALAQDPPKPSSPLAVTLAADKAKVLIGDDVQLEVRIENTGDKDADIAEPCFEDRSISFAVSAAFSGGGDRKKDYVLSATRPDAQVMTRLPLPRVTLGAKKSVTFAIRFPAIAVGKYAYTAKYADGGTEAVSSAAVNVEVEAATSGGRLAAIVEPKDGDPFTIWLAADQSPANVTNFASLVKRGFYNDMLVHRIVKSSWIQTGCPYGLGIGGPGYACKAELDPAKEFSKLDVALSGFEKMTGYTGSQFFILLSPIASLKGKYTPLGQVDKADEAKVDAIGKKPVDKTTDAPTPPVTIKRISLAVK